MQIGLGLPNTIPGTPPANVLEWARRADAGFEASGADELLLWPCIADVDPVDRIVAALH